MVLGAAGLSSSLGKVALFGRQLLHSRKREAGFQDHPIRELKVEIIN
jgi:hypothetical protein